MTSDFQVIRDRFASSQHALKALLRLVCSMTDCHRLEILERDCCHGYSLTTYHGNQWGRKTIVTDGPRPILALFDIFSEHQRVLDAQDDIDNYLGANVVRIELISLTSPLSGETAVLEFARK